MFIQYHEYEKLLKRERECRKLYLRLTEMEAFKHQYERQAYQKAYLDKIAPIRKKAFKRWMYAAGQSKTRQAFDKKETLVYT
jgi:hypothetical protein